MSFGMLATSFSHTIPAMVIFYGIFTGKLKENNDKGIREKSNKTTFTKVITLRLHIFRVSGTIIHECAVSSLCLHF